MADSLFPPRRAVKRTRGRALQELRARYLAEHPLCAGCEAKGRVREATQLDHIKPLAHGGSDNWANLQGLCVECHKTKTAKDMKWQRRPQVGADGYPI